MLSHTELSKTSPLPLVKDLLRLPPGPFPEGWVGFGNVEEAFRQLFREARDHALTLSPPEKWEADRGIVICGGGWKFFPGIFVTVRLLRHLGCKLPIQVWFLGDKSEFDPRMAAALRDYDVGWICANSYSRQNPTTRPRHPSGNFGPPNPGWQLKPYAALHAPFKEIIFLDADCYPAYNPEEFMAHPEYARVGAAFFPDLGNVNHGKLLPGQWTRFGLPYHDEPGWESGQFIVDKSRHYAALWLSEWVNQYADYVYKHMYGDKDTFHIAWRMAGHEVCVPQSRPGWTNCAFLQKDFSGRTLFVHRCRDKFRWSGEIDGQPTRNNFNTRQHSNTNYFVPELPHEQLCHDFLRESSELLRPHLHFNFDHPSSAGGWQECWLYNFYEAPLDMTGMTVLDAGANCGAFACLALSRGARFVLLVEPQASLVPIIEKNLSLYDGGDSSRWLIAPMAMWDQDDALLNLVPQPGAPQGFSMGVSHLHQGTALGTTPTISFPSILGAIKNATGSPVIDFAKIDCEGGEWPALFDDPDNLVFIERLSMETHTHWWRDKRLKGTDFLPLLPEKDWDVRYEEINDYNQKIIAVRK